jgi:hypothetical protein
MPGSEDRSSAAQLRALQVLSGGLIAGALAFLLAAVIVRATARPTPESLDLAAQAAVGLAIVAVPVAHRARTALGPRQSFSMPDRAADWRRRRTAQIVSYGLLEGATCCCAVALILSDQWWPLLAALLPTGAMLAWFPRAGEFR